MGKTIIDIFEINFVFKLFYLIKIYFLIILILLIGIRFAKWRAVLKIDEFCPSPLAI